MRFLLSILLLYITPIFANHVLSGHVVQTGVVHNDDGSTGPYICTTDVLRPLVCWGDIVDTEIRLIRCTHKLLRLSGPIDSEDFAVGNVVSFLKTEARQLGCPPPPVTDELSRVDQVLFRIIVAASLTPRSAVLHTEYISGALVVPELNLKIGHLPPSFQQRNMPSNAAARLNLPTATRPSFQNVGEISLKGEQTRLENGTRIPKGRGVKAEVKLMWDLGVSAGISELTLSRIGVDSGFFFDVPTPAVKMVFYFDAYAKIDVSAEGAFFVEKGDDLFPKIPIPNAGFSVSLGIFGKIRAGLFIGLEYTAEVKFGVKAALNFETGVAARQEVKVGLSGKFGTKKLPAPRKRRKIGYTFSELTSSAGIEGFVGVRPVLAAELSAGLELSASLGASFGIEASFGYQFPPFEAVTSGKRSKKCKSCHQVQGTIALVGKDLSLKVEGPLGLDEDITILESIFTYPFGTYCAYATKCPAGAELFLNGKAMSVTNDAGSNGEHKVRIARGDVIGIRTNDDRKRVGVIAAIEVDGVKFVTGMDEWKAVKAFNSENNEWATKGFNACRWPFAEVLTDTNAGDKGTADDFPYDKTGARYVWARDTSLDDSVYLRFVVGGENCS